MPEEAVLPETFLDTVRLPESPVLLVSMKVLVIFTDAFLLFVSSTALLESVYVVLHV